MQRLAEKLLTAFQLTRLSLVFGAIADVWFIVIYTRSDTRYDLLPAFEMPLAIDLVTAALLAVGLFAFATSLNDLLDLRHDAAFSPARPLPAGRIRAGQAVVITIGALLLAIAAAIPFGTGGLVLAVLAATAALFYNATGKYLPAIGVITAGLVHVAHMLIPNHEMAFMLPVWLIFTHVLVTSVIGYQLEGKRPQLTLLGYTGILMGWVFWSVVILGLGAQRDPMGYFLPGELGLETLVWPILAIIGFIAIAWWKVGPVKGPHGAEKLRRYAAMWHGVYAVAWFAAVGLWHATILMAVFTVVGIATMTLLKELTSTDPGMVGYRV